MDMMFEMPCNYMTEPTAAASWPHVRCPSFCVSEKTQSPCQEGKTDVRHIHIRKTKIRSQGDTSASV